VERHLLALLVRVWARSLGRHQGLHRSVAVECTDGLGRSYSVRRFTHYCLNRNLFGYVLFEKNNF
jgi:hypothetical protein